MWARDTTLTMVQIAVKSARQERTAQVTPPPTPASSTMAAHGSTLEMLQGSALTEPSARKAPQELLTYCVTPARLVTTAPPARPKKSHAPLGDTILYPAKMNSQDCVYTPAGFYSVEASVEPNGLCHPGFYCPLASTGPEQIPCPNRTYLLSMVGLH